MNPFGSDHYVPLLKCKVAEKHALAHLSPSARRNLTPLFEIVEVSANKSLPNHLKTVTKGLAAAVGPQGCFIDTRELAPHGPPAAFTAFAAVAAAGVSFVPVTGISRTADVAAALTYRSGGICLRITREEFEKQLLPHALLRFLNTHGLRYGDVDLIVDLGELENMIVAGALRLAWAFLSSIPAHNKWRTFTLAASSFPKSMRVVSKHSHLLVDRIEWVTWRNLHQRRASLTRLPTFGDCAIQHPSGVEGFIFGRMQVSATIRYTTGDQWLLIKGESTKRVRPAIQFPHLAQLLVRGPYSAYYRGSSHCAGCQEIWAAANGQPGKGAPVVWRRIGTCHHITTVVEQIAGLSWP